MLRMWAAICFSSYCAVVVIQSEMLLFIIISVIRSIVELFEEADFY